MELYADPKQDDRSFHKMIVAICNGEIEGLDEIYNSWLVARGALAEQIKHAATVGDIQVIKAIDDFVGITFEMVNKDAHTLIAVHPDYLKGRDHVRAFAKDGLVSRLFAAGDLKIGVDLFGTKAGIDIKKLFESDNF